MFSGKYKTFDNEEDLLQWLEDVLQQKEEGFEIEDDDTRELAWEQEKEDSRGSFVGNFTHLALPA